MLLGKGWRVSKLSTLLANNREVHSIGHILYLSHKDREQELLFRLLSILLLPFTPIMHNPNCIKTAHRIQYCFPPPIDLDMPFLHSHNSKSILLWLTRKKKWNKTPVLPLQWGVTVCMKRNESWIKWWGHRIALAMKGIWWNWNANE